MKNRHRVRRAGIAGLSLLLLVAGAGLGLLPDRSPAQESRQLVLGGKWKCPRCATENKISHENNCGTCGYHLELSIKCPGCGKQVTAGPSKCPHCGASLPILPPPAGGGGKAPAAGGDPVGGRSAAQSAWTCDRCGQQNPAGTPNCQRCGAKVPAGSTGGGAVPQPLSPASPTPSAQPTPKPQPEPKKELSFRDKQRIKKIKRFYIDMYAQHLDSRDWFIRSLSVVGLGRLLTDETTDKILDVLKTDRDALVRVFAFEALHARNPSLTDEQRKVWVEEGLKTALMKDSFRGDLRVGLIKAMAPYGPDAFAGRPRRVLMKYLDETDHREPRDHRTLKAMRELVTTWKAPKLLRVLVSKMSTEGIGNRVEYIVGGLNPQFAPLGRADEGHAVPTQKWRERRSEWQGWLREADLQPPAEGSVPAYTGLSRFLPEAEELTDPDDPTWREELEVEKLQVNQFDLVFVIDSTSSMLPVMRWVAQDLGKILSAMKLYAREPRIGTVYYRHEIYKPLMKPCCHQAGPDKIIRYLIRKNAQTGGPEMVAAQPRPGEKIHESPNYRVKAYRLTGRIRKLARAMAAEPAVGGHFNDQGSVVPSPGAVHAGLLTALKKQPWTKSSSSRKIIVLVGDAAPTDGSMKHIQKLLKDVVDKGVRVNAVKVGMFPHLLSKAQLKDVRWHPAAEKMLKNFDQIAQWGQGRSELAQFVVNRPKITGQIAPPPAGDGTYKQVIGQIIRSTLPEGYDRRVQPLVEVLAEYTDATPAERRR